MTSKEFKTYKDLYGVEEKEFMTLRTMYHPLALNQKIQWAKALNVELNEPHYLERDNYRISRVLKAIKFNQNQLGEFDGKHSNGFASIWVRKFRSYGSTIRSTLLSLSRLIIKK